MAVYQKVGPRSAEQKAQDWVDAKHNGRVIGNGRSAAFVVAATGSSHGNGIAVVAAIQGRISTVEIKLRWAGDLSEQAFCEYLYERDALMVAYAETLSAVQTAMLASQG